MSSLEALEALRASCKPLEEIEGGDCEIWLVKWPGNPPKNTVGVNKGIKQKFYWCEARSGGLSPLAGPYDTEEEARENFSCEINEQEDE